ncbi:MAG: hypothetical protein RPS47_18545 [Colwellia sp.]|jgi:hypothetical protein
MRIIDLYIGRFTHHSAATNFINLAVFVGICLSGVIRFIEQVKGN